MNLNYELLAVGVDRTPGAAVLRCAERDTRTYALVRTSALSPISPERAHLLLGPRATGRSLDRALAAAAKRRPEFFELYFGGHGNESGIALSDGLYSFAQLRHQLEAVGARSAIILLNSCGAAGILKSSDTRVGGLAGLDEDAWSVQLLASTPGARVFMASAADASTFEIRGIGGVFPRAMIRAMADLRPGDLDVMGIEFASDMLVFHRAAAIMMQYGVFPRYWGPAEESDFPMVRANRQRMGTIAIGAAQPAPNIGLDLELVAHGRRHLPTIVEITPTDALGNRLPTLTRTFVPGADVAMARDRVRVDTAVSPGIMLQLWRHGACRVTWDIAVRDHVGRLFGSVHRVLDYHVARSR